MGSDNGGSRRGPGLQSLRFVRDILMLAIGAFLAAHFKRDGQIGEDTTSTSDHLRVAERRLSTNMPTASTAGSGDSLPALTAEGWHPIHVYYGATNLITDGIPEKWRVVNVEKNKKGTDWFGQHGQDVAIAKFFNFKRNGFFVDLASNDAVWASNTFALETNYGWKGICIEPNPFYWFRLAFRKCHALGALVGEKNLEEVKVRLSYSKTHGPLGGIVDEKFDNKGGKKDDERRFTASLKHIFEIFQAPKVIDYISLDVEGAEEMIMGHFPFNEYTFLTMTIERPKDGLRKLLDENGYKHVLDFRRGDTLWAHKSVFDEGKALVEKNREDIDKHSVKDLPALENGQVSAKTSR